MEKCGGFGDSHAISGEVAAIAASVRSQIEHQAGTAFAAFEPHSYKSQVVAGMNYVIKIAVGSDEYIHARVFKPLPHTGQPNTLTSLARGKSLHDPL
jgi:cystatin-A/B